MHGGILVSVSYKKLWHILLDKDMKKKDLEVVANLSHYTVTKLSKNETVTTDVLLKICEALHCDISDIMEIVPNVLKNNEEVE